MNISNHSRLDLGLHYCPIEKIEFATVLQVVLAESIIQNSIGL